MHTHTCICSATAGDEIAADAPIILEGCCESWSVIAKDGSSFPLTSLPQRVGGDFVLGRDMDDSTVLGCLPRCVSRKQLALTPSSGSTLLLEHYHGTAATGVLKSSAGDHWVWLDEREWLPV